MSVTQILPFRQVLAHAWPPPAPTTIGGCFRIPAHQASSITIEWVSFFIRGGPVTIAMGDVFFAWWFVANSGQNLPFIDGTSPTVPLSTFSWVPEQGGLDINDPGNGGLDTPHPLCLSATDDPVWFVALDNNQSTGMTQAQWNTVTLTVWGWEVFSDDITRQFPAPSGLGGVRV